MFEDCFYYTTVASSSGGSAQSAIIGYYNMVDFIEEYRTRLMRRDDTPIFYGGLIQISEEQFDELANNVINNSLVFDGR